MSITLIIIIITVAISILAFERGDIMDKLIFNPYIISVRKEWYRFITHGFIHGDYMHLAVNMFVLYNFGVIVESSFGFLLSPIGVVAYPLMYLSAIAIASISAYMKHKAHPSYNALGASGATSAVLFASVLFNPMGGVGLIFIPIYIPSFIFAVLYLGYESYMARRGGDNIAHDDHFYGAVFGLLYPILLKPQLAVRFFEEIKNGIGL